MALPGEYIPASTLSSQRNMCDTPFAQRWIEITMQEYVQIKWESGFWRAQDNKKAEKIVDLEQEVARLVAENNDLKYRLFGKKSEKGKGKSEASASFVGPPRPRGHQHGQKSHPHTKHPDLSVEIEYSDLPPSQKICPCCGKPYWDMGKTEDTETIEIHVKAYKRLIKRKKYAKGCDCKGVKAVLTAPMPARLFNRNILGTSVWTEMLIEKFQYARSLNSIGNDYEQRGLPIAQGTLTDGFKRMPALFEPVIAEFKRKQFTENLFHGDETYWKEYELPEGKLNDRWYIWLFRSESVSLFIPSPSRSADVPIGHYQNIDPSIEKIFVICDRYSSYKRLARMNPRVILCFCWSHVRRDFLDEARSWPELQVWMQNWIDQIANLYHINHLRLEQWEKTKALTDQSEAFNAQQKQLELDIANMKNDCDQTLKQLNPKKEQTQIAVLKSLQNHWSGLTVFVQNPIVPMDNNLAERTLRGPAMGRKNYYGSGAVWSATLAAYMFSIFATLPQYGIHPHHWLFDYLTACANNHGKPPDDLTEFIPWLMSDQRKAELAKPLAFELSG